jgi:transposase
MVTVDTIGKVRRAYWVQQKKIKAIARELRLSRGTVRRIVRSGETALVYERTEQPLPKLGPFVAQLDKLLEANMAKRKRERLTTKRLTEQLKEVGYAGGYDAVRRYAQRWRQEHAAASAAAFVPLIFAPGEAYQFDWSHEIVILDGVTTEVKVAHMRLCHSRMSFIRAYLREAQEMVFDAHDKAFAFFRGACERGIYDNMKTAVDAIFVGKERAFNWRFQQMMSHYLVEPVACTPGAAWEKGQVESQVKNLRKDLFLPRPRYKSFADLNAWLIDQCVAHAKKQAHPEFPDKTIFEVFEAEREQLIPYRGPFDSYRSTPASVSKTCLVRFDNNKYSVMSTAVGRPVDVFAYADRIVVKQNGSIVGEHPRSFARNHVEYNACHYLDVLTKKPGALRNGAPFMDLPGALGRVQRKLKGVKDGGRQMVDILTAIECDGLSAVEEACAEALAAGTHSADVILNILARRSDPAPASIVATPEQLRLQVLPRADCARYDGLRPPPDPLAVAACVGAVMGADHGSI